MKQLESIAARKQVAYEIHSRDTYKERWGIGRHGRVVDPLDVVPHYTHTIQIRKFYLKLFEMAHCEIKRRHRKRKSIHIKKQYNFRLCSVFSFGSRLYGYFVFLLKFECMSCVRMQRIATKLSHDPFYFLHRQSDCVGISMHDMIRLSNSDKRRTYFNSQQHQEKKYYR